MAKHPFIAVTLIIVLQACKSGVTAEVTKADQRSGAADHVESGVVVDNPASSLSPSPSESPLQPSPTPTPEDLTPALGTPASSDLQLFIGSPFAFLPPAVDTKGQAGSFTITPTLPAGLTLNSETGAISGRPTTALSRTDYTLRLTTAAGATSITISIEISDPIAELPTLRNWYRADSGAFSDVAGTSTAVNNSAVKFFKDFGPSAAHAKEYLRPAPTYIDNAINGKPALRFTRGGGGEAKLLASDGPFGREKMVSISVIQIPAATEYWGFIWAQASAQNWSGGSSGVGHNYESGAYGHDFYPAGLNGSTVALPTAENVIAHGVPQIVIQDVLAINSMPDYRMTFGGDISGWIPFQGDLAEQIFVSGDPSPSERARIFNFLAQKYGTNGVASAHTQPVSAPLQMAMSWQPSFSFAPDTVKVQPALPTGLSLNATTGAISGTATTRSLMTNYVLVATSGTQKEILFFTLVSDAPKFTVAGTVSGASNWCYPRGGFFSGSRFFVLARTNPSDCAGTAAQDFFAYDITGTPTLVGAQSTPVNHWIGHTTTIGNDVYVGANRSLIKLQTAGSPVVATKSWEKLFAPDITTNLVYQTIASKLYAIAGSATRDEFYIFDTTDPAANFTPVTVSLSSGDKPIFVSVFETTAVIHALGSSKIYRYNITNPAAPVAIGQSYSTAAAGWNCTAPWCEPDMDPVLTKNGKSFALNRSDKSLEIIDIRNLINQGITQPYRYQKIALPTGLDPLTMAFFKDYLLVATRNSTATAGKLLAYDIRDSLKVTLVATYDIASGSPAAIIAGNDLIALTNDQAHEVVFLRLN